MVMLLVQRIVTPYFLGLEGQAGVEDVGVVGADNFVPVPGGGDTDWGCVMRRRGER